MFNYNHLYYFYVTVNHGSVTNAAKTLRISQPSLSGQIKALEQELNLSLFQKEGRRLVLTSVGDRAYLYCKNIFEAADDFSNYLKCHGTTKHRQCKIGVTLEIERPFVADILSSILRDTPQGKQPRLSLISDNQTLLMDSLLSGEIDAVVSNYFAYEENLKAVSELSMPVIAVAAPGYLKKLSWNKDESIATILKQQDAALVIPSDRLKIRTETDHFLQKLRIKNPIAFECDILAGVVRATTEGAGIAFLPQPYISRELQNGSLIHIGNETSLWRHSISIIVRNTKRLDPVVTEIVNHFVSLGATSVVL